MVNPTFFRWGVPLILFNSLLERTYASVKKCMIEYDQVVKLIDEKPEVFRGLSNGAVPDFRSWAHANILIVREIERRATKLKRDCNRDYYSVYCIAENLRWNSLFKEKGSPFKLNNNHTSYITRVLSGTQSGLGGMFKLRRAW